MSRTNSNLKFELHKIIDQTVNGDDPDEFINQIVQKFGHKVFEEKIFGLSKNDLQEPILNPSNRKFTAFPIEYPKIWELYKDQVACFWKAEEVDLSEDRVHFLTLNKNERYFIEMILAFFAASDGIVNLNIGERFINEIQITEALYGYQYQMMMENIHSEMYSLMIEALVQDEERKKYLFNAVKEIPAIKKMADWAFKWVDSKSNYAYRLVAFALFEGIFFSGAFAGIFWIKKVRNKNKSFMEGLCKSNKFIARDEGLHCRFACELYKLLNNKLSFVEISNMVREAVEIANNFWTISLPCKLIGMNSESMCQYIEYIGDKILGMLGYKKIFFKNNPFPFMNTIGLDDKTNFFELRPHEYQDSHTKNKTKSKNISLMICDEF